ncbi:G5 domain-containing protein [Dolosigranulum pigrum]|uniref:G5 domain-containing protein n=1 Tax=Dolosigranulum pigrum TaxID=29394 RepID=UPI001AD87D48|nr:G5 domain-containing protein [Dolosigranulum pigrum]QTJ47123.1 YSIRK-type signal peptide-containing protein [Dolosigranulum pigrum]
MVGKNNTQEKFSRRANKNKRYTLKKLSVGVASVALGTVLLVNNIDSVSAQTEDDAVRQAESIIDQVEPAAKEVESLLDQADAEGRSLTPEERQKIKEVAPQLLSAVEELEGIQDQFPKETIQDIEEDIAPEMEDVEQGIQEQEADAAQKQAEKAADEGFKIGEQIEALLAKENKTAEDKKEIAKLAQKLVAKGETIEGLKEQLPDDIQAQIDEDLATVEEETEQNLKETDAYTQAEQAADEGFEIGKRIEELLAKENKTAEDKKEIAKLAQELVAKGETIEGLQAQLPDDIQAQIDEDLATVEEETEQNLKETDAYDHAKQLADEGFEIGKQIEALSNKESLTPDEKMKLENLKEELKKKGKEIENIKHLLPQHIQKQIEEDLAAAETEQTPQEEKTFDSVRQELFDLFTKRTKLYNKLGTDGNGQKVTTPAEYAEMKTIVDAIKQTFDELEQVAQTESEKNKVTSLKGALIEGQTTIPPLKQEPKDTESNQSEIEEDSAAGETESTPQEEKTFDSVRQELFELFDKRTELYNKLGTDDNGQKVTTPDEYAEMKTIVEAIKKTFAELEQVAQTDLEKRGIASLSGSIIQGQTSIPPLKQEPKDQENQEDQEATVPSQSEKQIDEITKQADQIMSEIDQLFDGVAQDEEGNPVLTAKDNATYEELIKKLEREISTIESQLADLSEANKEVATEKLSKYKEETKDANFSFKVNNVQKKLVELGAFYDGLNEDNELTPADLNTLEMHIDALEKATAEIEAELSQIDEVRQAHLNALINNAKEEINVGRLQLRSAKIIDAVEEKWAKIDELYKSLQDIDNENYNATFTVEQLEQFGTLINELETELNKADEAIKELPEEYKQVIEADLAPYKAELLAGKNQLNYVNTIKQAEDIMASIEALFENLSVVDGEPVVSAEEQATFAKLIDELSDEIKKIEAELPTFSEEVAENVRQKLATYKQEIKDAQEQLKAVPFTAKPTENLYNKQYEKGEVPSEVDLMEIDFEVEEREDNTLPKGERKVIQRGVIGLKKVTKFFFPDVDEPVKHEEILKESTKEIVLVGTKESESQDDVNQPSDIYFTEIPYKVEEHEDNTLNKGERKVIQSGVAGLKKVTEFNQPGANESEKHEEIIKQPTNEIVLVGTKESESQDDVKKPSDIYFTEIPYKVEEREDNTLNKGERKVIQPGVTGLKKVTEFNQLGANEPEKHEEIIKQPTNEIVLVGTKEVTPPEKKDDFDAQLHQNLVQTELGVNRNDSIANSVQSDIATRDDFKADFLAAYKERTIEELKAKGVTNKFVFNIIQRANTIEGIDSVVAELNSSVKDKEKAPEKGNQAPDKETQTSDKGKPTPDQGKPALDKGQSLPDKGQETPDKGQQAPQSAKGLSTTAEAKPAFPQAELDKLVAEERAKREAGIQTLPNLTQAQKDQFVANLKKASTVDEFDAILGEAKALTATQPEKAEQSEKQVDKKQEEKKADQKQGERLPDTATGAWALGLVGVSSILAGAGIKKFKA